MFSPDRFQSHIEKATAFHGHWCPGLARGIRAAVWALEHFGSATDEEIVTVTETDMCAVDAIQALVGCTFGKGNLIFRNRGKVAFSFFRRCDGKSARIVAKAAPHMPSARMQEIRVELDSPDISDQRREELEIEATQIRTRECDRLLSLPFEELFEVKDVTFSMPSKARRLPTILCEKCGEGVMSSMIHELDGKKLCIDCMDATNGL
ncbi:MAG: TraR/DksA C4-type zinc finger protein [Mailhella sp.]|nr:TraR/DksA C4-type zinc finger protein [Mailhella sp.]